MALSGSTHLEARWRARAVSRRVNDASAFTWPAIGTKQPTAAVAKAATIGSIFVPTRWGILDARMSTDGLDGAPGWLPKIPPAHQWPAPDATRSNLRPDEPDQPHRLRGPQSMARRASVVQTPRPSRRWPSALIAPRAAAFSTLIASAAHATSASMIRNTPPSRKLPGTWHLPFPPTPRIFTGGGPHDFGAADRI